MRESWLWHVLLPTGRLDSPFFGDALQNAKQLFSSRLLQMTKYCIVKECENILCGYLYVSDLAFVILKGIYGFEFPKRFLEISSRDLFSQSQSSNDLITNPLMPFPFAFARLNALQAAVRHSHNNLLCGRLEKKGYYKAAMTPGLWKHKWGPMQFCLIVDNFGVEYVGIEHFNHLLAVLQMYHQVQTNMAGNKIAGINVQWDFPSKQVHIDMNLMSTTYFSA
jgi:hypothetical protein